MRPFGAFLVLLLFSSVSIAYAHPDSLGITVKDQDGVILYQQDVGGYEKKDAATLEPFSKDWFYHNFVWGLYGVIVLTVVLGGLIVHREEVTSKISKTARRT